MPSHDVCVVVPTIRDYDCVEAYVDNARAHGFPTERLYFVLVTEDFCDTREMQNLLDGLDVDGRVFDASARERWYDEREVADYAHVVPEASHAETSFGLLYLWHEGYDYGVFIDDDTQPLEDHDFFGRHMENLATEGEVRRLSSDERWVNVLHDTPHDLYPRGYPYSAMDEEVHEDKVEVKRGDVVASQGLWTDVPDLDAVRILMDGDLQGQAQTRTQETDYDEGFVANRGCYLTVCSMNLAFRREIVPAFYQMPMDDNPWDVGRFDDIWSGVLLKRACDVLGKQIYTGEPLCRHMKAPRSTFDDLANEVAGLELNEHFWRIADEAGDDAGSYHEVADALATRLVEGSWDDYNNGEFLRYTGEHLRDWLDCLEALERKEIAAD